MTAVVNSPFSANLDGSQFPSDTLGRNELERLIFSEIERDGRRHAFSCTYGNDVFLTFVKLPNDPDKVHDNNRKASGDHRFWLYTR